MIDMTFEQVVKAVRRSGPEQKAALIKNSPKKNRFPSARPARN